MTILRALLTIPFAIIAFILTAIVSDLIIVELLNAGHSIQLRSMQRAILPGSVLAGLLIGWYAVPVIFFKSKLANKIKSKVLGRFKNLDSRGSRLEFVLVCLFCVYYVVITTIIIVETPFSKLPKILFFDSFNTMRIIWGPLISLLMYRIIRWIWVGRK